MTIEETLASWISGLSLPIYSVVNTNAQNLPSVIYAIEGEFTPEDDNGPYTAKGYRASIVISNTSYQTAYAIANDARAALNLPRSDFLVTVVDRSDSYDASTGLYSVAITAEIIELQILTEPQQTGVRGAVRSMLLNNTDCGPNVFGSRIAFANCNQLPCINIRIDTIDIENNNDDDLYTAEIEVRVKLPSSVDSENQIEAIVEQVTSILTGDVKLIPDSLLKLSRIDSEYSSVGRFSFEERRIEFELDYYQSVLSSDSLAQFITADADWTINENEEPEAKDTLTLPQD